MAQAAVDLGADEGWTITIQTAFVVDEWPDMLAVRLPIHMHKDLTDDEAESALFSEYVRVNGDEAFDH
jgi:hypothetical protein